MVVVEVDAVAAEENVAVVAMTDVAKGDGTTMDTSPLMPNTVPTRSKIANMPTTSIRRSVLPRNTS